MTEEQKQRVAVFRFGIIHESLLPPFQRGGISLCKKMIPTFLSQSP